MPNGIPDDPRKRTRNHARLDVTLWFKIPDEILNGRGDATDVVRNAIDETVKETPNCKELLMEEIGALMGGNLISDITYRVGK